MSKGALSICTLEMYVEGAYRYFTLKNIRRLPTVGDIFLIAIDMWESQGLINSTIWCNSIGAELRVRDIQLEDVESVLTLQRMAHITEYDARVHFDSQNELLHHYA